MGALALHPEASGRQTRSSEVGSGEVCGGGGKGENRVHLESSGWTRV